MDVTKVTYDSMSNTQKNPEEIKKRALQAHHEQAVEYNAAINNCEHFATWCVYGKKISGLVRGVATGGTIFLTTAAGGCTGAVAGAAFGSVVPVVGTVTGAFIGGVGGATAGLVSSATASGITIGVVHSNTEETKKFK